MSFNPKKHAVRHWGPVPAQGVPLVYVEVGIFAEAVLWFRYKTSDDWGYLVGEKQKQQEGTYVATGFYAHQEDEKIINKEQLLGGVFWRDDGSTELEGNNIALLKLMGLPPLALVLESSRRRWSIFHKEPQKGYTKLFSVDIFLNYGDMAELAKTLSLLDALDWASIGYEPEKKSDIALSESYNLRSNILTSRKAFVWGGLLGLFLGAGLVTLITNLWLEPSQSLQIDRAALSITQDNDEKVESADRGKEQARTQARLLLERALAGEPEEVFSHCSDVIAKEQCREALDRLRVTDQHSLAYDIEGVQISTTVPGVPAFLFLVDTGENGFRISGVKELAPPVEFGINTITKNQDIEKKGTKGEQQKTDKPLGVEKSTGKQTQIVGGKEVTP